MASKVSLAALVAVAALAGCTTPDMRNQAAAYQFGPPPAPDLIERAIPAYFENVLIDPFTAHYQFGTPYKAWLQGGLVQGGGILWEGWAVDVRVNSRNRMGGYVGWTPYHVTFSGDRAVNAFEITPGPDVMWHPL